MKVFFLKRCSLKFHKKKQENTGASVSFLIKLQDSGLQLY